MTGRVRALSFGLLAVLAAAATTTFGAGLAGDGRSLSGVLPAGRLVAVTMPPLADHTALRSEPEVLRAPWTHHRPTKPRLVATPPRTAFSGSALTRGEVAEEGSAQHPGLAARRLLAAGRAPPLSRLT